MFSDEPTVDSDKDDEIIALLAERWPRCFMLAEDRRLPLKVGIFHDLKAALGGKVSPDQLSRTLGSYCSAPDYQRRLTKRAADTFTGTRGAHLQRVRKLNVRHASKPASNGPNGT
jgi:sRNA-binding protein